MYVDAVLGLSMTSSSVGLVLVEGLDGDGATMDGNAFGALDGAVHTSEQATAAIRRSRDLAESRGLRLHSIGVTWSQDADAEASMLVRSLSEAGFDNVVPIRMPEATEALARGIAEVIGHESTAVCVVEPGAVVALVVRADGAVQTAFNHAVDGDEDLIGWLSTVFTKADWQPEALVLVGSDSGRFAPLVPTLEDVLSVPVFAPAEAQLALARGAALASAHTAAGLDDVTSAFVAYARTSPATPSRRGLVPVGAATMLVAGVVTFVVSVSVAVSLQLSPRHEAPRAATPAVAAAPEAPVAARADPAALAPPVAVPPAPAAPAVPVEALPPAPEAAPPAPEAPVDVPETAPAPPMNFLPDPPFAGHPVDQVPAQLPPPSSAPAGAGPLLPNQGYVPAVPEKKPGILTRIKERLGIGNPDPLVPSSPPFSLPQG